MKLNCSVVKDMYVLYEENELSEEVKGYIKEHLEECEDCRKVYEGVVSITAEAGEKLPEPPKKLDEKLMLKLKLSRLRVAVLFIIAIVCAAVFSLYSQSRAYLVMDFQKYANNLGLYSSQINNLKSHEKTQNLYNVYNKDAAEMQINLNNQYELISRNLNIFEKHGVKGKSVGLNFDISMSTLVLTLNNRWENGSFSERDEEVYESFKAELANLSKLSYEYGRKLNSKFFIMNTGKLKESVDKLNTLSKVYTKYNKLPEEIKYLSENDLKAKISNVLDGQVKKVTLEKISDFSYRFKMSSDEAYNYLGEIDSVTGRILEMSSGVPSVKGNLVEVEKAREKVRGIILKNFGEGFDAKLDYLGVNADYQSTTDTKVYTFNVQPTFKGYNIFSQYRVIINARSNTLDTYSELAFMGNTPAAEASEIRGDVKYSPEEALKNITAADIDKNLFKYQETRFIKSMFSGGYVLVHYYKTGADTSKSNPSELYINALTGKEEWPAYGDGIITY